MTDAMQPVLSVQAHSEAVVAAVTCRELNHSTTLQLQNDLRVALDAAPQSALILDLSRVEFMPSLAMGMLVNMYKALKLAGRKCVFVGLRPLVLEAMQITSLDRFFEICSSTEEALNRLER